VVYICFSRHVYRVSNDPTIIEVYPFTWFNWSCLLAKWYHLPRFCHLLPLQTLASVGRLFAHYFGESKLSLIFMLYSDDDIFLKKKKICQSFIKRSLLTELAWMIAKYFTCNQYIYVNMQILREQEYSTKVMLSWLSWLWFFFDKKCRGKNPVLPTCLSIETSLVYFDASYILRACVHGRYMLFADVQYASATQT